MGIRSRSPVMDRLLQQAEKVAKTDKSVLLLGETGVGKGLLAETIHHRSPRRQKELITVNCTAMSLGLIGSELFGHEKGAFTSALARHRGLFEQAHDSTLFLDEIGDLPLEAQGVLLHILEADRLRRVGGTTSVPVDVRIIAATNRDLQQSLEEGTFRNDLYYRLSVFPVVLPPLRQRREDIPLLATQFVRQYARQHQRPVTSVSDEVLAYLQGYGWPGNVRQLAHWVERMMILCTGERLEMADVLAAEAMEQALAAGTPPAEAQTQQLTEAEAEKQRIIAALQQTNGVVYGHRGAARWLGMSHQTLRYRMRKYGIQPPKRS